MLFIILDNLCDLLWSTFLPLIGGYEIAQLAKGYELLNKLKMNGLNKTDTETDSDQIINKVSKPKITRSKQNQQMIARAVL